MVIQLMMNKLHLQIREATTNHSINRSLYECSKHHCNSQLMNLNQPVVISKVPTITFMNP